VSELVSAAVACGQVGWYVFPCSWHIDPRSGKKTRFHAHPWWKGTKETPSPRNLGGVAIREAFAAGSWNAYGIDMGASGLVGFDLDGPEAVETFYRLCREHGHDPDRDGAHVKFSPREGGMHVIFRNDPDSPVGTGAGVLAPGVDHRGVGGILFGTGSTDSRGTYTGPAATPAHSLPLVYPFLREALVQARSVASGASQGGTDDLFEVPGQSDEAFTQERADRIVADGLAELRAAPHGQINSVLLRVSSWLFRFTPEFLSEKELASKLLSAQREAWVTGGGPDDEDYTEARKTILNGRKYARASWKAVRDTGTQGKAPAPAEGAAEFEPDPSLPPWRRYALAEAERRVTEFDGTPVGHLPEEFWAARDVHQHVRAVAHGRMRGSTVALYSTLARLSSAVSPQVRLDTGIGKPMPLITYVAVVDPSGSGKTTGVDAAVELLPAPADERIDDDKGLTISTGQGMIEAYYGEVEPADDDDHGLISIGPDDGSDDDGPWSDSEQPAKLAPRQGKPRKRERGQVRYNRLFYCDEGGAFIKQCQIPTSIAADVAKELWTGDPTGQTNADAERRRRISDYTLGLVAGFQNGKIDTVSGLLADTTGTVQRFLFCAARDATLPRRPWRVVNPALVAVRSVLDPTDDWDGSMRLPDDAVEELQEHAWHRAQAVDVTDDPLDAHWPIHVSRLSALLALLDGETKVRMSDWNLAKILWESSVRYRNTLIDELVGHRAVEREGKIRHAAEQAEATTAASLKATDRHLAGRLNNAARTIGLKVWKEGRMARSVAAQACRVQLPLTRAQALDEAIALGYVELVDNGRRAVPGPVKPG
jgi:hypothetical protein